MTAGPSQDDARVPEWVAWRAEVANDHGFSVSNNRWNVLIMVVPANTAGKAQQVTKSRGEERVYKTSGRTVGARVKVKVKAV